MKLSEIDPKSLTDEELWDVVCGDIADDGASAEYAIILGGCPEECALRARAAAELYREGRVRYFIPSGGVQWDTPDGNKVVESLYMKRVLLDEGVPNNAIIVEDGARTTKENMIFSSLIMTRKAPSYPDKDVIIVTSFYHMKRSLALAKTFLPRMLRLHAYPVYLPMPTEELLNNEKCIKRLKTELNLMRDLIKQGIIEDISINSSSI